ncbi:MULTISPECIES: hypothetical protein [Exiguobacterium]|uniref:hypothetical protein n=1 Tax=Exiguobacterium sp. s191 TaxID=2751196 RepID=UPI001BE5354B|nr:hypothetical protein [Exiguobacterium sp. s191]
MSQRIPPAIYQFFPFGTQEKILLEDAADGVYFDFQEATADDKLYIQLFDQGFQHPPSKLYRSDATITGDLIEMTCHFEVDAPCVVQLFKMQYGQKKRMGSETETVTLTNETVVHVQMKRVPGAKYFKVAWKFLQEGSFRVHLRDIQIVQHVTAGEEATYAI